MIELKDKKILVTGATDGLGLQLCMELAKHDTKLVVHGRDQEKIDKLTKDLNQIKGGVVIGEVLCDLKDPGSVEKAFESVKELDILINNAGVWLEGDTIDATHEKISDVMSVNLVSLMLITRAILPTLLNSNYGQILNVSSVAGVEIPQDYWHTVYSAAKFGVQGFTEGLAKEFHNKNLRVMGFYPGGMATNLFKKAGDDYEGVEPWMFDPKESVEAMIFMLTRDSKVSLKRMDLINQIEE